MLLILLIFLFVNVAFSQTRQSLEEQRRQALQEIEETNRLLRGVQQTQRESVDRLNLLNAQLMQFNRLVGSINSEIVYINRQIVENTANVGRMNNDIERMKAEYAHLVVQAYRNRGQYNKLIYVLSAKDFNEAYRRMKYFQQYSGFREKQVAEIALKQEELRETVNKLTSQREEKEILLAEERQKSRELVGVREEHDREVIRLSSQERTLRNRLNTQQQRARNLQNEIERLIAEEARRRGTTTNNIYDRLTPEELLVSNNFKNNKGKLPWPIERGVITGFFGVNPHPLFKDLRLNNNGVDITTVGDSEVRTIFEGEVTSIGGIPGENMHVLVRHGNFITVYSNLVDVTVKTGDRLEHKEIIGKVYTERGANTAVLHFEIWEEMNKLNPEQWMTKM